MLETIKIQKLRVVIKTRIKTSLKQKLKSKS